MPVKLGLEARMTIKELGERGWSKCAIARTLGVTEGTVRYHLGRQQGGAVDGRSGRQPFTAAGHHDAIALWLAEDPGPTAVG